MLTEYSEHRRLSKEIKFVAGTSENSQGQHAIERPHKQLRKWVLAEAVEGTTLRISESNLDVRLQAKWRNRPIYDQYTPWEMWHGIVGQPQGLTRAERTDAAERSGAALREAYALLRQERATNRYLSELGRHGTPEPEEVAEGDHVVVLHGHAARRSKRYYS